MLIIELVNRPGIYRVQIVCHPGHPFPMIGSMVFVAGIGPIKSTDLTTLFFLPAAAGLFWAVLHYRLLDILPTEHLAVIHNIRDAVIVLDGKSRILFVNPNAEKLFLNRSKRDYRTTACNNLRAVGRQAKPLSFGRGKKGRNRPFSGRQCRNL